MGTVFIASGLHKWDMTFNFNIRDKKVVTLRSLCTVSDGDVFPLNKVEVLTQVIEADDPGLNGAFEEG